MALLSEGQWIWIWRQSIYDRILLSSNVLDYHLLTKWLWTKMLDAVQLQPHLILGVLPRWNVLG